MKNREIRKIKQVKDNNMPTKHKIRITGKILNESVNLRAVFDATVTVI